ncbi:hypothetical protein DCS_00104 [Drechmeria coniospora]|uniref:Uncharacterized protein n=1 Tax=Drechmeria coniospora TaxID=98403 RepID=A0A151GPE6_DRECN|nr:hypothetical protein DCS_00104 [Drechmeria coniospora]KYK58977.1 hypothetical protein DCS_00104 [Drechmeria coniospora]
MRPPLLSDLTSSVKGILKHRNMPTSEEDPRVATNFKDTLQALCIEETSWMLNALEQQKHALYVAQYNWQRSMHEAAVQRWYEEYECGQGQACKKSAKVAFGGRSVKLFVTEKSIHHMEYVQHDPHHEKITEEECEPADVPQYDDQDPDEGGDETQEQKHEDGAPWSVTSIEWELDFELQQSGQCGRHDAGYAHAESDSDYSSPSESVFDTDSSDSDSDTEASCTCTDGAWTSPLGTVDSCLDGCNVMMKVEGSRDRHDEREIPGFKAFDRPGSKIKDWSWRQVQVFDGLGSNIKGWSWADEEDEEEEEPAKRQVQVFDGLGSNFKGWSWADEEDEEEEEPAKMQLRIFDGLSSHLKGRSWADDDDDDQVEEQSISDIFDGCHSNLKGGRWPGENDNTAEAAPELATPPFDNFDLHIKELGRRMTKRQKKKQKRKQEKKKRKERCK